ncbi:hypothetical protein [uncultured Paraglaciecola sp.]|uniref:hypothetical protein n=1 Tax=uncultured Paraglaciecola sp. TaxID=1765024 RepID=UPI00260A6A7E|nr:hypothetical protein [uncultured Paraglaciecola sp.]
MSDDIIGSVFSEMDAGKFNLDTDQPQQSTALLPKLDKPEEPDFLSEGMDEFASQERATTGLSQIKAKVSNPDAYGDSRELADRFGVDVPFVQRNEDRLKAKAAEEDLAEILSSDADMAKWFSSGDNPAAIKTDDLRHLGGLRWLWGASRDSFMSGMSTVELADLRFRQIMGELTDAERIKADQLSAGLGARTYGADGWMDKSVVALGEQIPILANIMVGGIDEALIGAGTGAVAAGIAGQLGPQVALPEELVTVPGAAIAGAGYGYTLGQWQAGFKLEAGLAYDEFRSLKDEAGNPMDADTARGAAIVAGAASAVFEVYGIKYLTKMVPGTKDIMGIVGKDGVKWALKQPPLRHALTQFAKNTLKAGSVEISTEVAQEAIVMFVGEVAKLRSNAETGGAIEGIGGNEAAERLADAAIKTAQTMTILGPGLASSRIGMDLRRARDAERDADIIDKINEHAEGSELRERLPEKAKEAIDELNKDGRATSVFIDPAGIRELFQDDAALAEFVERNGLTDEFQEASAIGRSVEVPMGVYYANIAGTEEGRALQQHTKLEQTGMTSQEAEQFNDEWAETRDAILEDYEDQGTNNRLNMEGQELVYEDVKARAMDAGIVPDQADQYARLYGSFFSTMAGRTGADIMDLYQQYGFEIRRKLPGDSQFVGTDPQRLAFEAIRRGQAEVFRKDIQKAQGASVLQRIAERGGLRDDGGDLAAAGLPARYISEDGQGPDVAAVDLFSEGYFPEFGDYKSQDSIATPPGTNELIEAIAEEFAGSPRYSAENSIDGDARFDRMRALVALADQLDELGVNPETNTNEEIEALLERIGTTNADGDTATQGEVDGQFFQETRGSIQISEGRTVINMFDNANLSTFLHESGHFFLEVMRDLAEASPSPEVGPSTQLQSDWNALKEYLEIGEDGEVSVAAHEKFARSFEAYLFEGNAPSPELVGIMARFRSWLAFVYRSAKALNAPINDKIRGVMDRMLATDEEISRAGTGADFRPAFRSAEEAGMTDTQWQGYMQAAEKAVDAARRDMDVRMMAEVSRETTKEWRSATKEVRTQVDKELRDLPVYRLMDYLRTGKSDAVPENFGRQALDADAIEDILGSGGLTAMPKAVPPVYTRKGGVHPDVLAELFGFKSGHDMLNTMSSSDSLKKATKAETDQRMRRKFGDLMGDGVARAREAEAAIANDATGELLEAELKVLVSKGLVATSINRKDAQKTAKAVIASKTIREAIKLPLYMEANRKAANEAEVAIRAGKWAEAVAAKKRQMLNHYLAMEARTAERDTEKAMRYLNKFTGRKRVKGVDPEHLDQIEGMLERFDLRTNAPVSPEARIAEARRKAAEPAFREARANATRLEQGANRLSLTEWINEQEALGHIIAIPDALRDQAFRKPYKMMTVDDLMGLRDAVKNIEHLGRTKDKLLSAKALREFEAVRDELVTSIENSQDVKPADKTRNPTKFDDLISHAKSMESSLLKIEQIVDWMDSGNVNGPMRRFVWQPIADAEVRENDLRAEYTGKMGQIMVGLDKSRLAERISIPGIAQSMQRSEIMAVALNMGNESNLDKMMRGEAWTQSTLDSVVSHLNAEEWQAVQKIWDTVNELWPEIAALQKRLSGVEPPKVEAKTVDTPFGQLEGGYYPLVYDPRRAHDVEDRGAAAADKLFENTYLRPETRHGFTNERQQAYARPLLFDLDGAGRHMTAVIHDLTHREAIMDAHKLLTNAVTRSTIEARYSPELYKQFVPWLQSIAHDAYKDEGLGAVERMFKGIRTRSTIMGMGFRVSTILTQLAGYSSSLEMVSAKSMAGATKDFLLAPLDTWETVNAMSGEMRYRASQVDRDIRENLRRAAGKTGLADDARRFAFAGIGFMDKIVTVPTWMAAYNEHLAANPGDKQGAIAYGDKVVRLTQGSGGAKDLAAVQRNNELTKLVTMFYSYFSAYYNRQRNWGREAKAAVSSGDVGALPDLIARQVFMTVIPATISELLVGRGPSEEDDESWTEWGLRKSLFYPLAAVPVARDAFGVFDSGFSYSFTPASQAIDAVLIKPVQLFMDATKGELEARKAVKQTIRSVGYATKLPLGQLATTTDNVWKGIEEDDFQLRDLVLSRPY